MFDGEEVPATVRGPGYNEPLAVAAREHLANGKDDVWLKTMVSLSPADRRDFFKKLH